MIKQVTGQHITADLDAFIDLLRDVVDGGSSVNFLAPLDVSIATSFWQRVAVEAEQGGRVVLTAEEAGELLGCIHLVLSSTPNGLHRAEVQKMLVHSRHRRRGIGRALLAAAEEHARQLGKTLLVLDTERYSAGEALYTACGWQRVGVIPQFALNHDGTKWIDSVFFYKLLDGSSG